MKTFRNTIFSFLILTTGIQSIHAQVQVTGTVIDSITREKIVSASIRVADHSSGTLSDGNGFFKLRLEPGSYTLIVSNVGYNSRSLQVSASQGALADMGKISLQPAVIGLNEVSIIASEAIERKTPVAVSTIPSTVISRQLGDQPFPVIMKMVPGVYATRDGGGSGDASLNIRGFQQENVALLLNGIPIGSVENGLVYWNNWLGLADATEQIQVQRGLGASKVALNSVGGTINILTKTTEVQKGGSLSYSLTDYGNFKTTLMLSTGKLKNNLAVTFLGSYFSGPGYVDATYSRGFGYFLSVSKEINKNQKLVFIALGNPERHGQRNFMLSEAEIKNHGIKYNKDWGSYNGMINNASENFYHKPFISLNHYWTISPKSFLASSVYLTFGKGGGKWTDTFNGYPGVFTYYTPSGQVDWETIARDNATNTDIYKLADGTDTSGFSTNIQTDYLASHIWTGILSTYYHDFNDHFKLIAGIHGRYFKSKLQQKIRDLLGGNFYIDDYAYAIDGVAGRDQIRHTGDVIKVDNGDLVNFISGFAQMEYTNGTISGFIAGTISETWYQREDRYNYVSNIKSQIVSKSGFDFKGGINYNINEFQNIYLNAGYFSKEPYFKFVFGSFNNTPTHNLKNEKVTSAELGYGVNLASTRLRVNAYYIRWKDKSVLTNEYNQFQNPSMIQGLDALHLGGEMEIRQRIGKAVEIGGFLSLGNWKWKNNVTALLFDNNNVVIDTIKVFADGLFVGDAPQTQAGLFGNIRLIRLFDLTANWTINDRMYADFSPTTRTNPDDHSQSYRIPMWNELDLHLGYPFEIGKIGVYAGLSCYNVFNAIHIIRGVDGNNHDLADFTGFWSFGRNFNFSFKMTF